MPDLEPADARPDPARRGTTRRGMLRGTAGIGVAGLAAGVLAGAAPASASAETVPPGKDDARGLAHDQPLVAVVHDARTGTVDLYTGTQRVRFTDHQLAARLARAVG
jgi:hypothetical protein